MLTLISLVFISKAAGKPTGEGDLKRQTLRGVLSNESTPSTNAEFAIFPEPDHLIKGLRKPRRINNHKFVLQMQLQ